MGIVSKKSIEDVRARTDIVDLVGAHLPLKRAGANYKGLCPFHKEKTPSFHVNPQRQIYHCFGCGAGGDAFGFLMAFEGLSFSMAVRTLADRAGVRLSYDQGDAEQEDERDRLLRVLEEAAALFQRVLLREPAGEPGRAYLDQRAFSEETVSSFMLGYAPDRWDSMRDLGREKGFDEALMERAGMLSRSERDGRARSYDRFRGRLMIPIRDALGRIVGFSGRLLATEAAAAKYVNTPETPLFHKGRILFALDRARRSILDGRVALLCEGQFDAIRCHEAGLTHAVAGQGTALTEEHARLLKRCAEEVMLVPDADRAGEEAALRSAALLLAEEIQVSVVPLPEGEDPDSLLRKEGAEAFRERLRQASGIVDFQIDLLARREDLTGQAGLLRAVRAVLELVRHASGAVLRDRLLNRAAERLGLREESLRKDLDRGFRPAAVRSPQAKAEAPALLSLAERVLAEHLVHHPETAVDLRPYLAGLDLSTSAARLLLNALFDHAGEPGWSLTAALSEENEELRRLAARIEMAPPRMTGAERAPVEAARDLLLRIAREACERERAALAAPAGEEASPDLRRRSLELTHEINVLRRGIWEEARFLLEL